MASMDNNYIVNLTVNNLAQITTLHQEISAIMQMASKKSIEITLDQTQLDKDLQAVAGKLDKLSAKVDAPAKGGRRRPAGESSSATGTGTGPAGTGHVKLDATEFTKSVAGLISAMDNHGEVLRNWKPGKGKGDGGSGGAGDATRFEGAILKFEQVIITFQSAVNRMDAAAVKLTGLGGVGASAGSGLSKEDLIEVERVKTAEHQKRLAMTTAEDAKRRETTQQEKQTRQRTKAAALTGGKVRGGGSGGGGDEGEDPELADRVMAYRLGAKSVGRRSNLDNFHANELKAARQFAEDMAYLQDSNIGAAMPTTRQLQRGERFLSRSVTGRDAAANYSKEQLEAATNYAHQQALREQRDRDAAAKAQVAGRTRMLRAQVNERFSEHGDWMSTTDREQRRQTGLTRRQQTAYVAERLREPAQLLQAIRTGKHTIARDANLGNYSQEMLREASSRAQALYARDYDTETAARLKHYKREIRKGRMSLNGADISRFNTYDQTDLKDLDYETALRLAHRGLPRDSNTGENAARQRRLEDLRLGAQEIPRDLSAKEVDEQYTVKMQRAATNYAQKQYVAEQDAAAAQKRQQDKVNQTSLRALAKHQEDEGRKALLGDATDRRTFNAVSLQTALKAFGGDRSFLGFSGANGAEQTKNFAQTLHRGLTGMNGSVERYVRTTEKLQNEVALMGRGTADPNKPGQYLNVPPTVAALQRQQGGIGRDIMARGSTIAKYIDAAIEQGVPGAGQFVPQTSAFREAQAARRQAQGALLGYDFATRMSEAHPDEAKRAFYKEQAQKIYDTKIAPNGYTKEGLAGLISQEEAHSQALLQNAGAWAEKHRRIENARGALDKFVERFKSLAYYAGAGGILFGAIQGFKQMFGEITRLETTFTRMQGILPGQNKYARKEIESGVYQSAQDYGIPIGKAAGVAQMFAQAGLSPQDIIKETRAAMSAAAIGSIDVNQAVETQLAVRNITTQPSGRSLISSTDILDRISRIEQEQAVTGQDLAVAVQRVGSLATELQPKQLGTIDAMDALIGATTEIAQTTRVTGNQAATAYRFILSRLTFPDVAKHLQEDYKIKLGGGADGRSARPALDVLSDIAQKYKELKVHDGRKAQQLLVEVAGGRQVGLAAALFENWDRAMQIAIESSRSYGDSQGRAALQLTTLETKWNQAGNAALLFVKALMEDGGVIWALKGLADVATKTFTAGREMPGGAPMASVVGTAAVIGAFRGFGMGKEGIKQWYARRQVFNPNVDVDGYQSNAATMVPGAVPATRGGMGRAAGLGIGLAATGIGLSGMWHAQDMMDRARREGDRTMMDEARKSRNVYMGVAAVGAATSVLSLTGVSWLTTLLTRLGTLALANPVGTLLVGAAAIIGAIAYFSKGDAAKYSQYSKFDKEVINKSAVGQDLDSYAEQFGLSRNTLVSKVRQAVLDAGAQTARSLTGGEKLFTRTDDGKGMQAYNPKLSDKLNKDLVDRLGELVPAMKNFQPEEQLAVAKLLGRRVVQLDEGASSQFGSNVVSNVDLLVDDMTKALQPITHTLRPKQADYTSVGKDTTPEWDPDARLDVRKNVGVNLFNNSADVYQRGDYNSAQLTPGVAGQIGFGYSLETIRAQEQMLKRQGHAPLADRDETDPQQTGHKVKAKSYTIAEGEYRRTPKGLVWEKTGDRVAEIPAHMEYEQDGTIHGNLPRIKAQVESIIKATLPRVADGILGGMSNTFEAAKGGPGVVAEDFVARLVQSGNTLGQALDKMAEKFLNYGDAVTDAERKLITQNREEFKASLKPALKQTIEFDQNAPKPEEQTDDGMVGGNKFITTLAELMRESAGELKDEAIRKGRTAAAQRLAAIIDSDQFGKNRESAWAAMKAHEGQGFVRDRLIEALGSYNMREAHVARTVAYQGVTGRGIDAPQERLRNVESLNDTLSQLREQVRLDLIRLRNKKLQFNGNIAAAVDQMARPIGSDGVPLEGAGEGERPAAMTAEARRSFAESAAKATPESKALNDQLANMTEAFNSLNSTDKSALLGELRKSYPADFKYLMQNIEDPLTHENFKDKLATFLVLLDVTTRMEGEARKLALHAEDEMNYLKASQAVALRRLQTEQALAVLRTESRVRVADARGDYRTSMTERLEGIKQRNLQSDLVAYQELQNTLAEIEKNKAKLGGEYGNSRNTAFRNYDQSLENNRSQTLTEVERFKQDDYIQLLQETNSASTQLVEQGTRGFTEVLAGYDKLTEGHFFDRLLVPAADTWATSLAESLRSQLFGPDGLLGSTLKEAFGEPVQLQTASKMAEIQGQILYAKIYQAHIDGLRDGGITKGSEALPAGPTPPTTPTTPDAGGSSRGGTKSIRLPNLQTRGGYRSPGQLAALAAMADMPDSTADLTVGGFLPGLAPFVVSGAALTAHKLKVAEAKQDTADHLAQLGVGPDADAYRSQQFGLNLDFSSTGVKATDPRAARMKALGNTALIMAGQLGGAALGGAISGKGRNSYAGVGSSLGSLAGTAIGGPLGGMVGGLLGGMIGGLFGKAKPRDLSVLDKIERNTKEQVQALENNNRQILNLDNRLLNVPASFRVPNYLPVQGAASQSTVSVTVPITINPAPGMDEAALGRMVASHVSKELRGSGVYVNPRF
jgi:hypothetical protein